jgi:hypothetical protein
MATEPPIACSLGPDQLSGRADAWRRLAGRALIEGERRELTAVQRYRRQAGVQTELGELVRLEAECCPFLAFELAEKGDELVLTVTGPADAAAVIDLFSSPATR